MNEFKAGDVVRLKSGGPLMTVSGRKTNDGRIQCYYFAGAEAKDVHLEPQMLEKYTG